MRKSYADDSSQEQINLPRGQGIQKVAGNPASLYCTRVRLMDIPFLMKTFCGATDTLRRNAKVDEGADSENFFQ
jgi:hypothetical protein